MRKFITHYFMALIEAFGEELSLKKILPVSVIKKFICEKYSVSYEVLEYFLEKTKFEKDYNYIYYLNGRLVHRLSLLYNTKKILKKVKNELKDHEFSVDGFYLALSKILKNDEIISKIKII